MGDLRKPDPCTSLLLQSIKVTTVEEYRTGTMIARHCTSHPQESINSPAAVVSIPVDRLPDPCTSPLLAEHQGQDSGRCQAGEPCDVAARA